jgi:hypothetical protein
MPLYSIHEFANGNVVIDYKSNPDLKLLRNILKSLIPSLLVDNIKGKCKYYGLAGDDYLGSNSIETFGLLKDTCSVDEIHSIPYPKYYKLPDRWSIQLTSGNIGHVLHWVDGIKDGDRDIIPTANRSVNYETRYNSASITYLPQHIEISFAQFKRYVLHERCHEMLNTTEHSYKEFNVREISKVNSFGEVNSFVLVVSNKGIYYPPDDRYLNPADLARIIAPTISLRRRASTEKNFSIEGHSLLSTYDTDVYAVRLGCKRGVLVSDLREVLEYYNNINGIKTK